LTGLNGFTSVGLNGFTSVGLNGFTSVGLNGFTSDGLTGLPSIGLGREIGLTGLNGFVIFTHWKVEQTEHPDAVPQS
jgi:hypothetical protein